MTFNRVKVKICGITNLADALVAAEAGADALGFIFAPSPRQVEPLEVHQIVEQLPPFISTGGVFVDADPKTISEIRNFCELDFIQLAGRESPQFCAELGGHLVKTLHLPPSDCDLDPAQPTLNGQPLGRGQTQIFEQLKAYPVQSFLLDTLAQGKAGGTGQTFVWKSALWLRGLDKKIVLSGGLTPAKVGEAICVFRPYAVDVSSGLEAKPGKKDPVLIREFIRAVHQANEVLSGQSFEDEVLGDIAQ